MGSPKGTHLKPVSTRRSRLNGGEIYRSLCKEYGEKVTLSRELVNIIDHIRLVFLKRIRNGSNGTVFLLWTKKALKN